MKNKRHILLEKELKKALKAEESLKKSALKSGRHTFKSELAQKIPPKAHATLNQAFGKAFALVFEKGTGIIEKTYDKNVMALDHEIRDYAVRRKGGRREIRKLRADAAKTDFANLAVSAAEGIGLGLFGIGLPDIVLFTGVLLKGVYQSALSCGIDYEKPAEKYLILKMMEASMTRGEAFLRLDREVDCLLEKRDLDPPPSKEQFKEQTDHTAAAFADDMLLLKFIQGIPVAGILGGAANPACYRRVMRYVGQKYRKRYLLGLRDGEGNKK